MSNPTPLELAKREALKHHKPLVYDKCMKYDDMIAAGKSIAIVQLQYDYRCNFGCSHCSVSKFRKYKSERYFTPDLVAEFCKQADEYGLAHFAFTGGEPLAFPDLEAVLDAIHMPRFHFQMDTNGWLMTSERAEWLKGKGVDKIQLSIDSLNEAEHDAFRRKPGSHKRCMTAIDAILGAGLYLQVSTVVTRQRLYSDEFRAFLDFMTKKGAATAICWPKFCGEWEGKYDGKITREDMRWYEDNLVKNYWTYADTTPNFGRPGLCCSVRRIISVLKNGEVMPCPWTFMSLGNVFDTPFADILAKGMRYFGTPYEGCRVSESDDFIKKYVEKTYGQDRLLTVEEVIGEP